MRLSGSVAVITGSTRGIGEATARLFAIEGAKVVVNGRKHGPDATAVMDGIGSENAMFVAADVSTEEGASHLIREALAAFGRVDIVVNNAGSISRETLAGSRTDIWDMTLDANLTSAWLVTKAAHATLVAAGGGAVVNVSSIYGLVGARNALSYSVAKGGLISLTKSLAKDLAPDIRVNAVAPGNVYTELTSSAEPELLTRFDRETPLGRSAEPVEIARAILFLASSDSSFITGEVLVVDGGYCLR